MGMVHKAAICVCCWAVLLVALLTSTLAAVASPDCRRKCGEIDIPYPFGLDTDPTHCSREKDFMLSCSNDSSRPVELFLGTNEVISISVPGAKLRILVGMSYECFDSNARRFSSRAWNLTTPYAYAYTNAYTISDTDNVFTGVGCDTLAQIEGPDDQNFTGGCLSVCSHSSTITDGECSGIGCCQAAVPKGLDRYASSFGARQNHIHISEFNPCSYSFLVEKGNYSFSTSDLFFYMDIDRTFPAVLVWVIDTLTCQDAVKNKTTYACIDSNSVCLDSPSRAGYICNCTEGFEGNPYVIDGCQDIDECQDPVTHP